MLDGEGYSSLKSVVVVIVVGGGDGVLRKGATASYSFRGGSTKGTTSIFCLPFTTNCYRTTTSQDR